MVELLILTSSGGKGHISASKRVQWMALHGVERENSLTQEEMETIDVVDAGWLTRLGVDLGKFGVRQWNKAQADADLHTLNRLVRQQPIAEAMFGSKFEKAVYNYLVNHKDSIREVVSTQAQCTDRILKAVMRFNRDYRLSSDLPPVSFSLHITDLPTKYMEHFLISLNKLNQKVALDWSGNRETLLNYLSLTRTPCNFYIPYPYVSYNDETDDFDFDSLDEAETLRLFHSNFESLCPQLYEGGKPRPFVNIKFGPGPITQPFIDRISNKASKTDPLALQCHSQEEIETLLEILPREFLINDEEHADNEITLKLKDSTNVHSIMLGSQAARLATCEYVKQKCEIFKLLAENDRGAESYCVFVFCGNNAELYNEIAQIALSKRQELGNVFILPLGNQNHIMISQLYSMADDIIIRAGGLSIMEVRAAAKRNASLYVHAEIPLQYCNQSSTELLEFFRQADQNVILSALMAWEKGNTIYLQRARRGQVVEVSNMYNYLYKMIQQLFREEQVAALYQSVLAQYVFPEINTGTSTSVSESTYKFFSNFLHRRREGSFSPRFIRFDPSSMNFNLFWNVLHNCREMMHYESNANDVIITAKDIQEYEAKALILLTDYMGNYDCDQECLNKAEIIDCLRSPILRESKNAIKSLGVEACIRIADEENIDLIKYAISLSYKICETKLRAGEDLKALVHQYLERFSYYEKNRAEAVTEAKPILLRFYLGFWFMDLALVKSALEDNFSKFEELLLQENGQLINYDPDDLNTNIQFLEGLKELLAKYAAFMSQVDQYDDAIRAFREASGIMVQSPRGRAGSMTNSTG